MMPGMNPKQMQKMMKQMGMKQEDLDASRVEITLANGDKLVFDQPSIAKVNMMGQDTYQLSGEARLEEVDVTPDISQEDIQTVMDQANVSEEYAKAALEVTKGDIAEAIISLSE